MIQSIIPMLWWLHKNPTKGFGELLGWWMYRSSRRVDTPRKDMEAPPPPPYLTNISLLFGSLSISFITFCIINWQCKYVSLNSVNWYSKLLKLRRGLWEYPGCSHISQKWKWHPGTCDWNLRWETLLWNDPLISDLCWLLEVSVRIELNCKTRS